MELRALDSSLGSGWVRLGFEDAGQCCWDVDRLLPQRGTGQRCQYVLFMQPATTCAQAFLHMRTGRSIPHTTTCPCLLYNAQFTQVAITQCSSQLSEVPSWHITCRGRAMAKLTCLGSPPCGRRCGSSATPAPSRSAPPRALHRPGAAPRAPPAPRTARRGCCGSTCGPMKTLSKYPFRVCASGVLASFLHKVQQMLCFLHMPGLICCVCEYGVLLEGPQGSTRAGPHTNRRRPSICSCICSTPGGRRGGSKSGCSSVGSVTCAATMSPTAITGSPRYSTPAAPKLAPLHLHAWLPTHVACLQGLALIRRHKGD